MTKYIECENAKKIMCRMCEGGSKLVCGTLNDLCTTMRMFNEIPAADVVPMSWVREHMSGDYISREQAVENAIDQMRHSKSETAMRERLMNLVAADVLPRDEAIKMGAELAAMHGSDATSQQLEEAYLKGVEYGMTRRNVRPVVRGRWEDETGFIFSDLSQQVCCSNCGLIAYFYDKMPMNFCPNCGAIMEES